MEQMKSPYIVPDYNDLGYPVDFAKLRRQVVIRVARQRPVTRGGLLWGFVINLVLWAMIIMGGRWIWLLLR